MFPAYYIFNILLSILLVLHVIWTYYILKIVYKALGSGKVKLTKSFWKFSIRFFFFSFFIFNIFSFDNQSLEKN